MARTRHGLPGIYNSSAITLSNEEGSALAVDTAGRPIISPESAITQDASATVGQSTLFDSDGDNSAVAIKATPGALYSLEVSNINAADAFIQLFDVAAASVNVGTTVPKLSFLVPAGDGTKRGAMDKIFTIPIKFSTAMSYTCTTTATGSGDPSVGLVVNIGYK